MSSQLYYDATNFGQQPLGSNWDYWKAIDELSLVSKQTFDDFVQANAKREGVKVGGNAAYPKNRATVQVLIDSGFLLRTGPNYMLTDVSAKYINMYVQNYRNTIS